jgi:hypothetical protein
LKRAIEHPREPPPLLSLAKQPASFIGPPASGKARDFAFDEREIHSTDAGRLPCAEDRCHARLLQLIDLHETVAYSATQQKSQFNIRNQMKPARKIIARNTFYFSTSQNLDSFKTLLTMSRNRPTADSERNSCKVPLQLHSLQDFRWRPDQRHAEASQPAPGSLLADEGNLCAVLAKICGDGQQ